MALAVVLGVVLKLELIGYDGPAPSLPREPMREERDSDGARRFFYDLSPSDPGLEVADACARLGSRLERLLNSPKSPLPEGMFATRLTLEFGVLADREDESFSYAWPSDFLRVLADADIQLNVSHYLPKADPDDAD